MTELDDRWLHFRGFSHFQGKIWGFVGEIVVDIWDEHQQLGQPINLLV
jgi:hypothetical protein